MICLLKMRRQEANLTEDGEVEMTGNTAKKLRTVYNNSDSVPLIIGNAG